MMLLHTSAAHVPWHKIVDVRDDDVPIPDCAIRGIPVILFHVTPTTRRSIIIEAALVRMITIITKYQPRISRSTRLDIRMLSENISLRNEHCS